MRRRSKAGGELVKTRRHKTAARKPRNAPAIAVRRGSATDQETEFARIIHERDQALEQLSEALEQQTATSEVLRVISSSPGELEPVFQAMLEKATRICQAKFGALFLYENGVIRVPAQFDLPPALAEHFSKRQGQQLIPGTTIDQIIRTKRAVHIPDLRETSQGLSSPAASLAGARSYLAIPLLKDGDVIGAIAIYRQEVQPFTDKQIALVQNFAAQAVIAIENTRLLNELRQRTDDLSEALEQQTATSEVLKVVSSSPGELEPAFNAMLANATRVCEAKFGVLYLFEGDRFRAVALHGSAPPSFVEARRRHPVLPVISGTALGRVVATKQAVQIADVQAEPAYRGSEAHIIGVEMGGLRTVLSVPMLKEGELIGAFNLCRQEVRSFTDKQIELVTNFAAQAVIAIENTRLFNELRQSLEQQTATSDVLRVISSSPGELEPVFQAMLENAVRVCGATFGSMLLREGDAYRHVAQHNSPPKFEEFCKNTPILGRGLAPIVDHVIDTRQVSHTLDVAAEDPSEPIAKFAGARTLLGVPMLKDNEAIGVLGIYRQEVRPFTDKQIELVQNFAAQAVIAIENARLLNELRQRTADLTEALEQQTATSEVLRVISSSPGELKPMFQTMLENAVRICDAKFGVLYLYEGGKFRSAALANPSPEFEAFLHERGEFVPGPRTALGRIIETRQTVHIVDAKTSPVISTASRFLWPPSTSEATGRW
jgi:GAF domain-containing protein